VVFLLTFLATYANLSIRYILNRGNEMEFVILGLLMLKPMTAYEIGSFVKKNLALICSSSAGSVQIALKKLLKNGLIAKEEFVENSVNKKVYSITESGKQEFLSWCVTPMQTNKVKNMELSKLFFLGFADKCRQKSAISNYIEQLKNVQNTLLLLKITYDEKAKQMHDIQNENIAKIAEFSGFTIEYGIDSAKFEIDWYTKLLHKMEG
jgi:PadR family transcriptional regulator AphA